MAPWILPAMFGGFSLGNTFLDRWFQGRDRDDQNNFNLMQQWNQQAWNEKMWDKQKAWSKQMWHLQNEYNSPQAQMQRFEQAGLNPKLMYGRGSSGQATPVQQPDIKGYTRAEAANVTRGFDAFGDYQRMSNIRAQTSNLQAQTDLAKQNAYLTAQKTANELLNNQQGKLSYGIAKELRDTQVEAAKVNLENQKKELEGRTLENKFNQVSLNPRVNKIKAELKNALETGKGIKLQNQLKKWEVELSKANLTPKDMWILRFVEYLSRGNRAKAIGKDMMHGAFPFMRLLNP